jgi:zinc protease
LDGKNLERAREYVLDEIAQLGRRVGARELARAKRSARAALLYSAETNGGRAHLIGYYYRLTGSTDFLNDYLANIEKITASDVRRVARRYLDPAAAIEIVIAPNDADKTTAPSTE